MTYCMHENKTQPKSEDDEDSPAAKLGKRMRCSVCPRSKDRKTKNACDRCLQPVCNDHRTNICFNCVAQFRRISQSLTSMNLSVPQPDGQPKTFSPKIEEIANSIAQLNLIEVAELSDLLKKKLNLPDAPAMAFPGLMGGARADAAEKEEDSPVSAQTSFCVKLLKYDEKQKVALIKEIKSKLTDMNLVQAKKFVESAPVIVKDNIGKTEAEELKETLSKVGGEVEIS